MTDFIGNHLWQSTLFAAAAALLTLFFQKNHARIRYSLWLAASIKFLIPFSLLIAIGSSLDFRWQRAASVPQTTISYVEDISQPFGSVYSFKAVPLSIKSARSHLIEIFLYAAWLMGAVAVLVFYLARGRRLRLAIRNAKRMEDGRAFEAMQCLKSNMGLQTPIRLASSAFPMEPGVFGIFLPVLLLPEGILGRLYGFELEAIIAHELIHVRRQDNLMAAIHMFIQALFWFHPMVWWLGAKLVQERERACDEAVLQLGKDPQSYAEGILKICEFYLESPLSCVTGVTGADMKKRIQAIMTNRIGNKLSVAKKILLAGAGIAVGAIPLFIGLLNAPQSRAQSQAGPRPSFEVASIKPAKDCQMSGMNSQPGRLTATCTSLDNLIILAYKIQPYQLSGGPDWIFSSHFDIEAKSSGPVNDDQFSLMLQFLLEERFQLKIHRETRDVPVYDLLVAKGGHKLQPAKDENGNPIIDLPKGVRIPSFGSMGPDGKSEFHLPLGGVMGMNGQFAGRAGLFEELVRMLSITLGHPLIDKTGITGRYDFSLKWAPDSFKSNPQGMTNPSPSGTALSADLSDTSLFTAIQEQLGLTVASGKGPGELLIIDSVAKPSEN